VTWEDVALASKRTPNVTGEVESASDMTPQFALFGPVVRAEVSFAQVLKDTGIMVGKEEKI